MNSWIDTGVSGDNGKIFVNVDTLEVFEEANYKYKAPLTNTGKLRFDEVLPKLMHKITNIRLLRKTGIFTYGLS